MAYSDYGAYIWKNGENITDECADISCKIIDGKFILKNWYDNLVNEVNNKTNERENVKTISGHAVINLEKFCISFYKTYNPILHYPNGEYKEIDIRKKFDYSMRKEQLYIRGYKLGYQTGFYFYEIDYKKDKYCVIIGNAIGKGWDSTPASKYVLKHLVLFERDVRYVTEYNLERNFFTKDIYTEKTRNIIITEYIPLAKLILSSENQFIKEKVKCIKTLSYILLVENDENIRKDIITSINYSEFSKYQEDSTELKEKTKEDLKNNVLMANYIAGKITSNQLFSKYLEKSIIDSTQIEEILNCIKICRFKFNDDREFDAKIFYYIFLHSYKENDIDIRNKLIEMSDIFINTDCEKEILEILCDHADNLSYEESIGYIKLLRKVAKNEKYKYKEIIEKLKSNANYNIRVMVEKYIVKEQNE